MHKPAKFLLTGLIIMGIGSWIISSDNVVGWFVFSVGVLFVFCFYLLLVSESVRDDNRSSFAIGLCAGINAIVGLLVFLIGLPSVMGYVELIFAVVLVMYGLYLLDKYKQEPQKQVQIEYRTQYAPPVTKQVQPIDDDDPLGVLPYANRVRPRTPGESETPR